MIRLLTNSIILNPFWLLHRVTFFGWFLPLITTLGTAIGLWGANESRKDAKEAAKAQAAQARHNAQVNAENAYRQAEEIAYQNELTRRSIGLQSERLAYEYAYGLELFGLQLDRELTAIEREIDFIDFDLEELGLTTDYRVRQKEQEAAIYSARAGMAAQAAEYLKGVKSNTYKEFGLVEVINQLNLYDIYESARNSIEEVDYYATSAKLESKQLSYQAKSDLNAATQLIEKGKAELGILRRNNSRTLAAVSAKLASSGRAVSGSSKDIVRDKAREAKETEKFAYGSYQIQANAQVGLALVRNFSAEMKKREAAFLEGKKVDIQEQAQRDVKKAAAQFAITTIGYENQIAKLDLDISQAQTEAGIYSMYASMSLEEANYITSMSELDSKRLLTQRANYLEDIQVTRNLGLLELDRQHNIYNFTLREIDMTLANLEEDTQRARDEAAYLAQKYYEAGELGYSLALQQGQVQANNYLMQSVSYLFQGMSSVYQMFNSTASIPSLTGTASASAGASASGSISLGG